RAALSGIVIVHNSPSRNGMAAFRSIRYESGHYRTTELPNYRTYQTDIGFPSFIIIHFYHSSFVICHSSFHFWVALPVLLRVKWGHNMRKGEL
ncbi:MAG: hypothetical protein J6334_01610, partial [Kiritimatiellae bacterium]|nr:hypothetical protein [Kiritimatiellia bacterium]